MRKIFLDVGGNTGQSIEAAMDFDFDIIYCFEPVLKYCEHLKNGIIYSDHGDGYAERKFSDPRVMICSFGLWVNTEKLTIYSPHTMAASVFEDHQDNEGGSVECDFVRATDWCKENLLESDFVVMKLNCEGSECTILDHLIDTEAIKFINHVMIDFDAFKIPSQHYRPHWTLAKLNKYNINYVLCDNVMHGATHYDRICNWLNTSVSQINYEKNPDGWSELNGIENSSN